MRRIAVIGAGPIGLEAALFAAESGFEVDVYERGCVAEHVLAWGHVRLFSPFIINSTERGRSAIRTSGQPVELPRDDALLTGREFVEQYLTPLSRVALLRDRIHEQTEVIAVGRSRTWKGELVGHPERGRDSFQLLVRDARGERVAVADYVLDCSGVYGNHNWLGAGGMPCIGERAALRRPDYQLPDILGGQRAQFAGRKTLVVGSGYSAATAVTALAQLAREHPQTRAVWITRTGPTTPMRRFENDPLPERDRLAECANRLALSSDSPVEWRPEALVRAIEFDSNVASSGSFLVSVEQGGDSSSRSNESPPIELLRVDRVIANVGYRPDRSLYEELQVHECYASQGPMKLAAKLLGESSNDCLSQTGYGGQALSNPEPGFFILGAKSYGRDSRFLLQVGFGQIRDVFSLLESP